MEESPLLDKVVMGKDNYVVNVAKVSECIDSNRDGNLTNLETIV